MFWVKFSFLYQYYWVHSKIDWFNSDLLNSYPLPKAGILTCSSGSSNSPLVTTTYETTKLASSAPADSALSTNTVHSAYLTQATHTDSTGPLLKGAQLLF